MDFLLGAAATVFVTLVVVPLSAASVGIDRHDRQIAQRDEELEEWLIVRHRQLLQRMREITEDANARNVLHGGTVPAGDAAAKTIALYEYRDERRRARNFVLNIEVDERWTHWLMRRVRGKPFPSLTVPARAVGLIDRWEEGTDRNALTWSLDNILSELAPP